jgi:hypothetical protein
MNAEQEALTQEYIATFDEKHKIAYEIAKSHLGMSYQVEKSNGFLEWKKKQDQEKETK